MTLLAAPPPTRIRAVREALGIRQADLARRMGVHRSVLCRVELGRLSSWPKFRRDAAVALGIAEDVLFGDSADSGATA